MLKKLLPGEGNISLCFTDKNVFAKFGNHRISSTLIDGQFPNYQRVIPKEQEKKLLVQRELLDNALKRVSVLVEQKSRRIFLKIQPNVLTVTSEESEIGMAQEEIPCEYSGPEEAIALNYLYLMEPLREIESENVCIEFTETSKAITLKSEPEKDYLHVIMPMQTN
jgi:DNA polymerase-3 subunit beta